MKERGWADDTCGRRVSLAQAGEHLCYESRQVTKQEIQRSRAGMQRPGELYFIRLFVFAMWSGLCVRCEITRCVAKGLTH